MTSKRINIIKPGLFTTLQDQGRVGYKRLGIPISGAMDSYHFQLANQILDLPLTTPNFEISFLGPTLRLLDDIDFAVAGHRVRMLCDGHSISSHHRIKGRAGQILHISEVTKGYRAYLAFDGMVKSSAWLASHSVHTLIPATGRPCQVGDLFEFSSSSQPNKNNILSSTPSLTRHLTVLKGPDYERIGAIQIQHLLNFQWKISTQSNRVAYRLTPSSKISHVHRFSSIISSPTAPGIIQILPNGDLVVLMRDAPTAGGYLRPFQMSESMINNLAQLGPGELVSVDISNPSIQCP